MDAMKKLGLLLTTLLTLVFCAPGVMAAKQGLDTPLSQDYLMTRRDYLELMVGNYIHGFKRFGTTAYILNDNGDKMFIEIYYNEKTQSKIEALLFKRRLEKEMPYILEKYDWAKGVPFEVNVFAEGGD
jgi:hypothetical protein